PRKMRADAGQSRHALPDIGIASDPSHLLLVGAPTHNARLRPGKFSRLLSVSGIPCTSRYAKGFWHPIGTEGSKDSFYGGAPMVAVWRHREAAASPVGWVEGLGPDPPAPLARKASLRDTQRRKADMLNPIAASSPRLCTRADELAVNCNAE